MPELETWEESFAQATANDGIELEAHTFAWVMRYSPLLRVTAIDEDGGAAYVRARDSLKTKLAA